MPVLFVHLLTCIQRDSKYLLIKQNIDLDLQDRLFEHSRMLVEKEMKDNNLSEPTWIRVKRKWLLPETLGYYELPWEWDEVEISCQFCLCIC